MTKKKVIMTLDSYKNNNNSTEEFIIEYVDVIKF